MPDRPTIVSAVALTAFYLLLQLTVLPPDGFFTGDQGTKYLQVLAVVERGAWQPWIVLPARDIDPDAAYREPLLVQRGQRLVGAFPPLLPTLSAPLYVRLGLRGLYIIPAIAAGVVLLAATRLARPLLGPRLALLAGWCAVVATPVLFYGAELWEHAPAVALTTVAAACFMPGTGAPRRRVYVLGGACVGLATAFRLEAAVVLVAFFLALFATGCRRHASVAFCPALIGFGLFVVPQALVNWHLFGSVLPPQVELSVRPGASWLATRAGILGDLLLPAREHMLFVFVVAAVVVGRWARRAREDVWLWHVAVGVLAVILFGMPAFRVVVGGWRPADALAYQSVAQTWPFLLGLVYLAMPRRPVHASHVGWVFLLISGVACLAGLLAVTPVAGGSQWGARILLPAAPLLAVAVAAAFASDPSGGRVAKHVRAGLSLVIVLSVLVQAGGLALLAHGKRLYAGIARATEQATQPGDVIVTDLYWFPEVSARLQPHRRLLFMQNEADIGLIAARARALGFPRLVLVTSSQESSLTAPPEIPIGDANVSFRLRGAEPLPGRGLVLHVYQAGS